MRFGAFWLSAALLAFAAPPLVSTAYAQTAVPDQTSLAQQIASLSWVKGPASVPIGDEATIAIPKGAMYLDAAQTKRFLQLNGNPAADDTYTIAPDNLNWFAVYAFDPSGYVNDKETIDPEKLYSSLLQNQTEGNERRKTLGISGLFLDGWSVQPHYDRASHNLEWGTVMHDEKGSKVVNYTSTILGRGGVMRAVLVSDPAHFATDLPAYRSTVANFSYLPSKRYEAHQDGDKLAAYGLGALITGGAAAVAVKTGLFAGIFAVLAKFAVAFSKAIVVGVLAVVAGIANWAKKLFNRRVDAE